MTTNLEAQITDWEFLHRLMGDARKLKEELQKPFLRTEFYPRIKEYAEKYHTKYDHLNKPK